MAKQRMIVTDDQLLVDMELVFNAIREANGNWEDLVVEDRHASPADVATFQIDFADEIRTQVIDLIDVMRHDLSAREIARSHEEPPRCRACGYRAECGQTLESF